MKKLRVLEAFGGIGACTKALKNLGIDFEVVDYIEIDKYAVKSYNAIFMLLISFITLKSTMLLSQLNFPLPSADNIYARTALYRKGLLCCMVSFYMSTMEVKEKL